MDYQNASVPELKEQLVNAYALREQRDKAQVILEEGYKGTNEYKATKMVSFLDQAPLLFTLMAIGVPIILVVLRFIIGPIAHPIMLTLVDWFLLIVIMQNKEEVPDEHGKNMLEQAKSQMVDAHNEIKVIDANPDYREFINFVPAEYRESWGLAALFNIFDSGRAVTWREGLSVLDERIHRARMEQSQAEIMQMQRDEMTKLASVEYQVIEAKKAAIMAGDAAIAAGNKADLARQAANYAGYQASQSC